MGTEEPGIRWIVCRAETRTVSGRQVACPAGDMVSSVACLDCRFLVTSSAERSSLGWCELPELNRGELATVAAAARRLAPVRMAGSRPPVPILPPRPAVASPPGTAPLRVAEPVAAAPV